MPIQKPTASLDLLSLELTVTNGGTGHTTNYDYDEEYAYTGTEYGFVIEVADFGVENWSQLGDIELTDSAGFSRTISVGNNKRLRVRQFKHVFDYYADPQVDSWEYSDPSDVIEILIKAKPPVLSYDKLTGVLNIKTEPITPCHASLDVVKGYGVNLSNGAVWDLTNYLTNSLDYDVPLEITESTDIMVWAINADDSLSSPSNIEHVGVFMWQEEASFEIQSLDVEFPTAYATAEAYNPSFQMESFTPATAQAAAEAYSPSMVMDSFTPLTAMAKAEAYLFSPELVMASAYAKAEAYMPSFVMSELVVPTAWAKAEAYGPKLRGLGPPAFVIRGPKRNLVIRKVM